MRTTSTALALLLCTLAPQVGALEQPPASNAALRYWMAFALMQNPPADDALAERLLAVSAGEEPWDESLVAVLDANGDAIATMRRGSRLARCDWGLEYERHADAPVAHLARGRALARLNLVQGRRLLQRGDGDEAIETLIAGVRFSSHLAEGGPFLSALVAGASLEAHLRALASAVRDVDLAADPRRALEREVQALGEDGLDWAAAAGREVDTLSDLLEQIGAADDPTAMLRTYLTAPAGGEGAELRAALRRSRAVLEQLRPALVSALQAPPAAAAETLRELDARAARDPLLATAWPRASRLNESRGRLIEARAGLLEQLRVR